MPRSARFVQISEPSRVVHAQDNEENANCTMQRGIYVLKIGILSVKFGTYSEVLTHQNMDR